MTATKARTEWVIKQTDRLTIVFYPLGLHKFLLTGFGFLFLSWPGILIGFLVGCLLDIHYHEKPLPPKPADLGMTFMMLAMAVMKANGKIGYHTIRYAHQYIAQHFGDNYLHQRRHIFEGFRQQHIPVEALCEQVDVHLDYPAKMQLIYFLIGIAYADGKLSRAEMEIIAAIADDIHLEAKDFKSLMAMHKKVEESAFEILEITAEASNAEVKKAYYKLAKLHHPDRVAHLGEEYQRSAKEKFQRIQQAYEEIRQSRNL